MTITPEDMRDKYGFKFVIGDLLQLKGRADPNEKALHIGFRRDPPMLRVVIVKLLMDSDGCERMYYIRAVHPSGDWSTRSGTALGLYEFTEEELELFVKKDRAEWKQQETTNDH